MTSGYLVQKCERQYVMRSRAVPPGPLCRAHRAVGALEIEGAPTLIVARFRPMPRESAAE